jgi:hypothetical protein
MKYFHKVFFSVQIPTVKSLHNEDIYLLGYSHHCEDFKSLRNFFIIDQPKDTS